MANPAAIPAGYVQRYDFSGPLLSPVMREDGTLLMSGRVAKPGILPYRQADGSIRRELVLAEDLHNEDSLATLGRAPVTLTHPAEMVTPDSVGDVGVGDVDGEVVVEKEGGFVTVKLAARRRDAIDAVMAGTQELSPGYLVRLEETSGDHPVFGRFDAIQRDRRYNHLAIVDRARAGPSVRLRTDGAAVQVPDSPGGQVNPNLIALLALMGIRNDNEDAAVTQARARLDSLLKAEVDLGALQGQMSEKDTLIDTLTTERDTAVSERDAAVGERDALNVQVEATNAEAVAKQDAEDRVELDKIRESLKLDSVDGEDNPTLRRRLAAKVLNREIKEDEADTYLRGVLAIAPGRNGMWDTFKMDTKQPRKDALDGNDDDDPKRTARNDGLNTSGADHWLRNSRKHFDSAKSGGTTR
jgi:hypothetical protein